MSETYKCRPSTLIDVTEPYDAYCFDEACSYIRNEIRVNKQEPNFSVSDSKGHYTSFSAMYNNLSERGVNTGER